MRDPTFDKFHRRLASARSEIQRVRVRIARAQDRLKALEDEEATIVKALELIGEHVPDFDQLDIAEAGAQRRGRRGGIRAIDAALKVIAPGEEASKSEIARRILEAEIPFSSSNLENALATAMNRSPQFEYLGRGVFKRCDTEEAL